MQVQYIDNIINGLDWSKPIKEIKDKVLVRAIPNKSFWSAWRFDKELIKAEGIRVNKEDGTYLIYRWIDKSKLVDNIDTVGVKVKQHFKYTKLKFGQKLRKHQRPHALQLINAIANNITALDGSDTGTGKTYTAPVVARNLNLKIFVVCAKSNMIVWERVALYMGMKDDTVIVMNYEKLRLGNTKYIAKNVEKNKKNKFVGDMVWNSDLLPTTEYLMIFDEVHRCSAYNSLNSKMLIAAKAQGYKILKLSATVADNPLQMKAIGYSLGLFPLLSHFWAWVGKYGCYRNFFNAYEFTKDDVMAKEILGRLHTSIYPERGSRIRIGDLGNAFPKNQVIAEAYSLDNAKKVQEIYDIMEEELEELKFRVSLDGKLNPLTVQLRARQKIELLKVPLFVEMAKDLLKEKISVIIFVNFTATLKEIATQLKTNCLVYGEQRGKQGKIERQQNIDDFQNNKEQLIVINTSAGGESISLHDIHGKHRRTTLISPVWSAKTLHQILGRAHRDGGKTPVQQRIMFIANTVEDKMAEAVKDKLGRLTMLNDGDLTKGLNIMFKKTRSI